MTSYKAKAYARANPIGDIVFEQGAFSVRRAPKGGFEVYKTGDTASVRVAIIGYPGDKGLERAKLYIAERMTEKSGSRRNPSKTTPRIYVANLAAYNAGRLRGAWIEPSTDADELAEQVIEAIGGNPDNEWAFHDYDGFPDMGENPSLKDVAAMTELLEEHPYGIVKAAMGFVDRDDVDALRDWLDEGYGTYESKIDYVEQMVDDMGGPSALGKQTIDSYFDYDAFGHDVLIDADEEERERLEGMSDREIGESVIDDVYGDKIPKDLADRYFDYDSYARDVFMGVASVRTPEGLVVFNAR